MKSIAVASVFAACAGTSLAGPLLVSASDGDGRACSALFENDSGVLQITLTNTSNNDVLSPIFVLTAIFFDMTPPPIPLTRISAVLAPGSSVFYGPVDPGNVVGGEYAFDESLVGAPGSAGLGVSSIGAGLFGPSQVFPGSNLQGPGTPDGLQYGITSAGDNLGTGNAAVTGNHALIKNAVIFRLGGLPLDFNPEARITNVSFQYGTDLSEPNIPAPGVLGLLGLAGLVAGRRRR